MALVEAKTKRTFQNTCKGVNSKGKPCGNGISLEIGYCHLHKNQTSKLHSSPTGKFLTEILEVDTSIILMIIMSGGIKEATTLMKFLLGLSTVSKYANHLLNDAFIWVSFLKKFDPFVMSYFPPDILGEGRSVKKEACSYLKLLGQNKTDIRKMVETRYDLITFIGPEKVCFLVRAFDMTKFSLKSINTDAKLSEQKKKAQSLTLKQLIDWDGRMSDIILKSLPYVYESLLPLIKHRKPYQYVDFAFEEVILCRAIDHNNIELSKYLIEKCHPKLDILEKKFLKSDPQLFRLIVDNYKHQVSTLLSQETKLLTIENFDICVEKGLEIPGDVIARMTKKKKSQDRKK